MNEIGTSGDIRAVTVPMMMGRVYFITDGEAIKIGYSDAPEVRLRGLQGANAKRLRIINTAYGTLVDEKRLHKQFDHLRLSGEWFRPDPELVEFITEFCQLHPAEIARRELAAWATDKPKGVQNAVANLRRWLEIIADPLNTYDDVNIFGCTAMAVEALRMVVERARQ